MLLLCRLDPEVGQCSDPEEVARRIAEIVCTADLVALVKDAKKEIKRSIEAKIESHPESENLNAQVQNVKDKLEKMVAEHPDAREIAAELLQKIGQRLSEGRRKDIKK